jgi:hypothetical protein
MSNAQIDLVWTDNATGEVGYIVERSLDGLTFIEIASLPAGSTAYSDTGLAPSSTYYYQVRAFTGAGPGDPSAMANATTLAVAWNPMTPAGVPPSARAYHTAVYVDDAFGPRMIVFGAGFGDTNVYQLTLTGAPAWTVLVASVPAPPPYVQRFWHTAVYDSGNGQVVFFGGANADFPNNNEVWAFQILSVTAGQWALLLPASSSTAVPSARTNHAAVYDPVGRKMVVFGGHDGVQPLNDTWELRLPVGGAASWNPLTFTRKPLARYYHSAVYDSATRRMVIFGGNTEAIGAPYVNDAWGLDLAGSGGWTRITPYGVPPTARIYHSAVYDAPNRRMVVFGGDDGTLGALKNDVWALTLSGLVEWHAVAATGTPPSGRFGHSAVYDAATLRMILFGGDDGSTLLDEVWELGL